MTAHYRQLYRTQVTSDQLYSMLFRDNYWFTLYYVVWQLYNKHEISIRQTSRQNLTPAVRRPPTCHISHPRFHQASHADQRTRSSARHTHLLPTTVYGVSAVRRISQVRHTRPQHASSWNHTVSPDVYSEQIHIRSYWQSFNDPLPRRGWNAESQPWWRPPASNKWGGQVIC